MAIILGIDIGTSSVKAMLWNTETALTVTAASEYDVSIPKEGYAEQDPEIWWNGLRECLKRLSGDYPDEFRRIEGIGYSGQMHGVVGLDGDGKPLRPAIIWLDQRSRPQIEEIYRRALPDRFGTLTCNRLFPGFAFPSLMWIRENEPKTYDRIAAVQSPKDYIRYRMTGCLGTDVSDASATGIFDTAKRTWSVELIREMRLKLSIFPTCHESSEVAGCVSELCSRETGLPAGIPVVYGSGDQPAQSIGNGVCGEGQIICNIGTGGQIAAYSKRPVYDTKLRTHTFCHAIPGAYTIFGATLTSGMSQKWLKNNILKASGYPELTEMAAEIPPGSGGLIFLPYLSGERTPYMNPSAKGVFFGLTLDMDRRHLSRAVMEGVIYSLKDCLTICQDMGIDADTVIASGGGARSPLWLQMQADIFGKKIKVCRVHEQACLGAAIEAAVGLKIFPDFSTAAGKIVDFDDKVYEPERRNQEAYRKGYEAYRKLYADLQNMMVSEATHG